MTREQREQKVLSDRMSDQPADRSAERRKCAQCGLVNFAVNETCRRCGAALTAADPIEHEQETVVEPIKKRGVRRRVLWLIGVT